MTSRIVEHVGLVIDDDPLPSPAAAAELARRYITERMPGLDEWDLAELLASVQPTRAWWGGDELGHVGRDHPDARAVVVVHLPPDVQTQLTPAPPKSATEV